VLAYALLYSVARFTLEFWRDDPRGEVMGLFRLRNSSPFCFSSGHWRICLPLAQQAAPISQPVSQVENAPCLFHSAASQQSQAVADYNPN